MKKGKKRLFIFGLLLVVLLVVGFSLGLAGKKEQEEELPRVGAKAPNFQLTDLAGQVVE